MIKNIDYQISQKGNDVLKKMMRFLKSMQFGMLLLVLVIACSFEGSLIVQQREPMEYVNRYGADAAQLIMALGLDDVFSAPYFIALMAALCLNLTLCSIVRLPRTMKAYGALEARAEKAEADTPLEDGQADKLRTYFEKRRYKKTELAGRAVYGKNRIGFFGSFVTHLSFLLILLIGAAAVITADVTDRTAMPGETIDLGRINVTIESFRIEDETGRLDYMSKLTAETSDGKKRAEKEIRVNEPLSFEGYKIYQQTYGTAGAVRIDNLANGASDVLSLTEACFLTLDGRNGMFYQALYPGYIREEDGSVTLIETTSGAYSDPVYDVLSVSDGATAPVLAFPGETLTIGDVSFTMLDPVSYPGLRIKHMSPVLLGLLYASFVLMVAGLYLCFFAVPVAAVVTDGGYTLLSPKAQTGLMIELEALLKQ